MAKAHFNYVFRATTANGGLLRHTFGNHTRAPKCLLRGKFSFIEAPLPRSPQAGGPLLICGRRLRLYLFRASVRPACRPAGRR